MEELAVERLILVVENNPAHLRLIQTVLSESTGNHRVIAIADGNEAMLFLRRDGKYENADRPDLVLLDLNLPGKDGREVLAEIKADANLRRIPVVVLTSSTNEDDVVKSYTLQGNCYVIKSHEIEPLVQIVKRIQEFWLGIVTLPTE
ncbi:response regulator with CheY-like receiver domain and winged-helix DNA-binding domain [Leptolyngbyaceae cyanobacterium JSC-12]|nr:response regulator with CheY-like receiver domain and winged-helix DNA-binding domain [Leptolyngbyaceae cyanobacterium JSC-12]